MSPLRARTDRIVPDLTGSCLVSPSVRISRKSTGSACSDAVSPRWLPTCHSLRRRRPPGEPSAPPRSLLVPLPGRCLLRRVQDFPVGSHLDQGRSVVGLQEVEFV